MPTPIFSDRAGDSPRAAPVRIPLRADTPPVGGYLQHGPAARTLGLTTARLAQVHSGRCIYDNGRAVAMVWYPDGYIRSYCADHDEPQWPLPAEKPFWWEGAWPYGPPPPWRSRVWAWLRSFPLRRPD